MPGDHWDLGSSIARLNSRLEQCVYALVRTFTNDIIHLVLAEFFSTPRIKVLLWSAIQ